MIETIYSNPDSLMHYGVPGMRWGHRKTNDAVGTGLTVRRIQNEQPYIAPYRPVANITRMRGSGSRSVSLRTTKSVGFEVCSNLIIKHKTTDLKSVGKSRSTNRGEKTFNSWTDMVKV